MLPWHSERQCHVRTLLSAESYFALRWSFFSLRRNYIVTQVSQPHGSKGQWAKKDWKKKRKKEKKKENLYFFYWTKRLQLMCHWMSQNYCCVSIERWMKVEKTTQLNSRFAVCGSWTYLSSKNSSSSLFVAFPCLAVIRNQRWWAGPIPVGRCGH